MFGNIQSLVIKIIRQRLVRCCANWHTNDVWDNVATIQAGHIISVGFALLDI